MSTANLFLPESFGTHACSRAHHDGASLDQCLTTAMAEQVAFLVTAEPCAMKQPCISLLASRRNGTLYVGGTSDRVSRFWQYTHDLVGGFPKRFQVHTLVWYELHDSMVSAIRREKAIKAWKRPWKLEVIERTNLLWRNRYADVWSGRLGWLPARAGMTPHQISAIASMSPRCQDLDVRTLSICPETPGNHSVRLNLRNLEAWGNSVQGALDKIGVFAARVTRSVAATDLETTAQNYGGGQVTHSLKDRPSGIGTRQKIPARCGLAT